ncbi:MAG: glutaminyl-peptide cyclotransferase [Pseudonocardiaceae bacterium]
MPATAITAALVAVVLLATALTGCTASTATQLRVQILGVLPHDPTMYTEGLEIHDGVLYEGSGLIGQSRVRATALSSSAVLREAALPSPLFGEGVTVTDDRLWQLTWTSGTAIERDPATLGQRRQVSYQGQGWGLCHDGHRLVMSDGSDRLTFRDPVTFASSGQLSVRLDGEPVRKLNELECAGGVVWANVFETDQIMRIDPSTGAVTGVVDASGLLRPPPLSAGDVLNGIASIPGTDQFLITGKDWPSLFRVRFVPESA